MAEAVWICGGDLFDFVTVAPSPLSTSCDVPYGWMVRSLDPALYKFGTIPSTQERVGITLVEHARGLHEVIQQLESQTTIANISVKS
jgi:hypothetical protein